MPAFAHKLEDSAHCFEREFELAENHAGGSDLRGVAMDEVGRDFAVGSGDDDDAVLALVVDEDGGDAGGAGNALDGLGSDAGVCEIFDERGAEDIGVGCGGGSDGADHLDGIAEARGGDGLVGAFAAGGGVEVGADDGLAGDGDGVGVRDQVHVDAADDDDGFAGVCHA